MSHQEIELCGQKLEAHPDGTLWWPRESLLCVSDMHLGKAYRYAQTGGSTLPPFDTVDTLTRLGDALLTHRPQTVVCLGDSFDDLKALDSLSDQDHKQITSFIAGREWIWIEGNHDPGPVEIGGVHRSEYHSGDIVFRHIAQPDAEGEISGHYHPKGRISAKGRGISRPCFVCDEKRIILPAFGTYTGGLHSNHGAISQLMGQNADIILTGSKSYRFPLR